MKSTVFAIAMVCQFGANAIASPIQWTLSDGGNGHFYELVEVPGGITWPQARDAAVARGGHLTAITSSAENDFVFSRIISPDTRTWGHYHGPWLGGFQDSGDAEYSEPTGAWRWVTGEQWNYAAWYTSEPNDAGGAEDYLAVDNSGSAAWNDNSINGNQNGTVNWFIMEFSYPIPSTRAVWTESFGTGFGLLSQTT